MAKARKDNKGRALRKGESQRTDNTYVYTYTDPFKKRRFVYAKDCYTDNINRKGEYQRGDQMNAEQRIRLIGIIEKIEKNPEFSNKLGLKNTFDLISEK